ncbi:MAG TPA: NAD(P)-binding oxidoreductase [Candidatus Udaeobacter sp.]|nr:NAD(P)-binding oxidoreductase [Candidatus Udaeobacter sp.]
MKLVVLGGTGRTGQLVVEQALAAGHTVTALVRSPEKLPVRSSGLRIVAGEATDAGDLAQAMAGADAVISALGGSGSVIADSTRAIVKAAHQTGVERIVVLSSFLVETDRMAPLPRLLIGLARSSVIKDKRAGEELLRQSDLDWTVAYASRLTDGAASGHVEARAEGTRRRISERISRADVAEWLIEAATSRQTSRRGIDITGPAQRKSHETELLEIGGMK